MIQLLVGCKEVFELYAIAEDGTTISIGTATTDPLNGGIFSLLWTPPREGKYIITAIFPGSKSYWDSYASTAIAITAAPPAAPTPATAEQAQTIQSTTESLMSRIDTIQTILIIVIVIVILLVAYDIYINRKMFRQASK